MAQFGTVFCDHFTSVRYVDGSWQQPSLQAIGPISLHPAAHVFHYASTCFEGFKAYPHDKIEIRRTADEGPILYETDPHIVAIASDAPIEGVSLPVLDLDDVAAIAEYIINHCALEDVARGVA